jgi:hypothetical protein
MIARQLAYLADALSAGTVLGARVPIALTVRGDLAFLACLGRTGAARRVHVSADRTQFAGCSVTQPMHALKVGPGCKLIEIAIFLLQSMSSQVARDRIPRHRGSARGREAALQVERAVRNRAICAPVKPSAIANGRAS